MIKYQLPSVKQAYEPWIYSERMMFLDGSLESPIIDYLPDANDNSWIWAFDFDHDTTLIHVCIKKYISLSAARSELIEALMDHRKVVKCGGFTDMLSEEEYLIHFSAYTDAFWGVNWTSCDYEEDHDE